MYHPDRPRGFSVEIFSRERPSHEAVRREREKNHWLPLACSAGVLWAGESCFVLLQIAIVGIFDFMTEEVRDKRNINP